MLPQAVQQGLVSEDTLRHSVKTLFRTRMLLGEFDLPEMNIYGNLSQEIVQSPAHQELAKQAAKMSFVLLKNNNFLPITQKYKKIAVSFSFISFEGVRLPTLNQLCDLQCTNFR